MTYKKKSYKILSGEIQDRQNYGKELEKLRRIFKRGFLKERILLKTPSYLP